MKQHCSLSALAAEQGGERRYVRRLSADPNKSARYRYRTASERRMLR